MRRGLTVLAGIAAFLAFVVAMVPAEQLSSRLPAGIVLQGVDGTVWSGEAASIQVEGVALGEVEWSCRPWAVLRLGWSCRVTLSPAGGALAADLAGRFGRDSFRGEDIVGRVPLSSMAGLAVPAGWSGTLELDVAQLRVVAGRPVAAEGKAYVRSLRTPGVGGQPLGDFELTIGEGTVGTGAITARLRDLGGPLRLRGAIELEPDGSYLASGEASPGPGAGPAIFDTLAFLGPPDALGRRPFAIEGTL